jgi:hypothetical protein
MAATAVVICAVVILLGCGPNRRIINSAAENQPSAKPLEVVLPAESGIDDDIKAMRTADFSFIYVFRRIDGAALDEDDRKFLVSTIPVEVNRRRLSDGNRALIVGSNFRIPAKMLDALKKRFAFEDFSKPESEIESPKPVDAKK